MEVAAALSAAAHFLFHVEEFGDARNKLIGRVFLDKVVSVRDDGVILSFGAGNVRLRPRFPAPADRVELRKQREEGLIECLETRPRSRVQR